MNISDRLNSLIKQKKLSVRAFEQAIGASNGLLARCINKNTDISSQWLSKIIEVFNDVNPQWLLTGSGPMLNSTIVEHSHTEDTEIQQIVTTTRPRIPFNAAAGALSIAIDSVIEEECERLPIIPTLPDYDFTIQVRGDSMMPNFHSGDEVACRFINEASFIQWGLPHVLDTAQGVVLKSIYQDEDNIICKSFNSRYPDFSIPKDEILRMAIVVGFVRQS